ncbi:hypothetical protein CUJ83_13620 [Methanocella sp. CWC-04]|uniref:Uncharacterized protein n=1 Tax=Methanooceanicella nereidis TaxID=2052831 RepID=A0AAP2W756_9EURY|nr:glycosyltransferase family 4 protein [Methanocella sp. CWC-04]MCD1296037.1 hypothetical protein [Methanocella sp. CWC-04]
MMPKKVLVLTTTFPRWNGDVRPEFVYDLSKWLQKNDMEIVVLAPHHPGAKKYEVMEGIKVYRYRYFIPVKYQRLVYGGGVLPNIKQSWLAKVQVPVLFLSGLYCAGRIIKKENIDIVHSHWIIPGGLTGSLCSHFFKTRHLMTLHGAGLFALEKMPFKKAIAGYILKNSDGVTVVSEHIKKRLLDLAGDMRNYPPQDVSVLPMGIYPGEFLAVDNKEELKIRHGISYKNVILFIGRLVDKKGLPYLIDAMPGILSRCPDTALIVCGDGPMREDLEKAAKKMGIQDKTFFKGYISKKDKSDYLQMADILVIPSIVTGSGDVEGLPVTLLEGMASGLPVIATDVGGMKDAVTDGWNGFMVPEKDPASISDKAVAILKDNGLASLLSKNALETARKYDWERIGGEYKRIMESFN